MTFFNQVSTIEEHLSAARIGCGLCEWDIEGGRIQVKEEELREAMELAYEEGFPAWVQMVEVCLIDAGVVDAYFCEETQ